VKDKEQKLSGQYFYVDVAEAKKEDEDDA
jgi:hypothetical protein